MEEFFNTGGGWYWLCLLSAIVYFTLMIWRIKYLKRRAVK